MNRAFSTSKRRASRHRRGTSVFVVVFLTIGVFAIDHHLKEPNAPIPKQGSQLRCEIRQITDGDTAIVGCEQGKIIVRIWGIDAPETGQKPWGDEAKEFLEYLLNGKQVTVEIFDKDRYGRAVAKLYANDEDAGLTMIREGKAAVYRQYNDSQVYRDAEREAKVKKLGVWSEPGAQQKPWAWRKVNPNPHNS